MLDLAQELSGGGDLGGGALTIVQRPPRSAVGVPHGAPRDLPTSTSHSRSGVSRGLCSVAGTPQLVKSNIVVDAAYAAEGSRPF